MEAISRNLTSIERTLVWTCAVAVFVISLALILPLGVLGLTHTVGYVLICLGADAALVLGGVMITIGVHRHAFLYGTGRNTFWLAFLWVMFTAIIIKDLARLLTLLS